MSTTAQKIAQMSANRHQRRKIVLSDGRLGYQTTWDGELTEITITQESDGSPCRHVYGPQAYYQDHVYCFSDLGNVTWEVAD